VDEQQANQDKDVLPQEIPAADLEHSIVNDVPAETAETQPESAEDQSESTDLSPEHREPALLVEAILFTTDSPLPAGRISQIAQLPGVKIIKQAVQELNEKYERMGCSFRVEEIGGGYQMMTLPEYHDVLGRLSKTRGDNKLSQAGLEALAIIAYRQPILRADVEAIRGVASGEILRTLMEKQLVKIVGRAEVIGRPMLYGTTRRFLDVFGLGSLEDLPRVEELKNPRDAFKPKPAPAEEPVDAQPAAADEPPVVQAATEPAAPRSEPTNDAPAAGEYHSDSPAAE